MVMPSAKKINVGENGVMDALLPQFMKAAGVTEELKARDQMAWVGLVNNCMARVEEIIYADLIYV